ncbi:beta-galactosidase [Candidatus Poribacteria bacterium]
MKKHPPITHKCPHFLHGGDYNPEQWIDTPEIWDEDMRLMKLAHCNAMSIGIFSWVMHEPEEGQFSFDWMDRVMDMLADNGVYAILATPSGAKPAWMSQKYPEIRRVARDGRREHHQGRHNHCFTSPVYREKTTIMNTKLAERYGEHPALIMWHVSNEYGGECHCDLCYAAFREWLKERYGSLDELNRAWWATFWSHRYTDWDQIEPKDDSVHGLTLDWRRFVTHQTVDFFLHESKPLRNITPDVPVTVNMMGTYPWLDYWKFAPHVDVISWDSYPFWHGSEEDWTLAARIGFTHDVNRSLKGGQPFMLIESTPSATNWMDVAALKRPRMHVLSSLQAVAHGSDTVQYFQWRKSRGSAEKFHGAVVDHVGHENTRVFRDVADLGEILEKLDPVVGTSVEPEVAIIFDWENRWAIDEIKGPRNKDKNHDQRCILHYRHFWMQGIPVDVINMDCDFSNYKLLIAPMLYMVHPGVAERIEAFVKGGGVFIATYLSGIANETDLCFLGGFPGPLRKVLGIWAEEIDALYDWQKQSIVMTDGNALGLSGEYSAKHLADIIHLEGAESLASYGHDFYAGQPALTVNYFGQGEAYYIASRNEDQFLHDFYGALQKKLSLKRAIKASLPEGVTAQLRTDGEREFIFLLNFNSDEQAVNLGEEAVIDLLTGDVVQGEIQLPGYGSQILLRAHHR